MGIKIREYAITANCKTGNCKTGTDCYIRFMAFSANINHWGDTMKRQVYYKYERGINEIKSQRLGMGLLLIHHARAAMFGMSYYDTGTLVINSNDYPRTISREVL